MLRQYAGAIGMTIPWAVLSVAGSINAVAAGSRQAWAFSRDQGLPFSRWMQKITIIQGTPLPINAMMATLSITLVLSCIIFGSTEAFNSIASLVTGAISVSYALSIGCVLWRRLYGAPLPPARFSLGRWGVPINLVGCLFQILVTVMCFFPTERAVTAYVLDPQNSSRLSRSADTFCRESMNWGSTMFGGVAILASIYYYFHGHKVYEGPVVHVKQL